MSGFLDFADVKARCSIEQAANLLGLKTTEERMQLRAPCPACGTGEPRAIVITPSKNLFLSHRKREATKSPWCHTSKA